MSDNRSSSIGSIHCQSAGIVSGLLRFVLLCVFVTHITAIGWPQTQEGDSGDLLDVVQRDTIECLNEGYKIRSFAETGVFMTIQSGPVCIYWLPDRSRPFLRKKKTVFLRVCSKNSFFLLQIFASPTQKGTLFDI